MVFACAMRDGLTPMNAEIGRLAKALQ